MELRMKKKLLEQQIAVLDSRAGKITNVLEKKRAQKMRDQRALGSDNSSNQSKPPPSQLSRAGSSSMRQLGGSSSLPDLGIQARTFKSGSTADRVRKQHLLNQYKTNMERESRKKEEARRRVPPKAGAFRRKEVPKTLFPVRYNRGELPCSVEHTAAGYALTWVCPLQTLDYDHYLPIFFDGIRATEQPYKFLARQGVRELLEAARGYPERVLPCLPEVVAGLRRALDTRDPPVLLAALGCVEELVGCNAGVGEALVPYYRQLLSVMNLFLAKRENLGDAMDYGQRRGEDLAARVGEVLEALERTGGPDAFANIKYSVPTYETCMI